MNANHQALCSSSEWAEMLRGEVLAPIAASVELGEELLEVGPGPGAATGWLRLHVKRLTALELDRAAAARLSTLYEGSNVTVVVGDCTCSGLPDQSFDSVAAFTMLHHLPTAGVQYAALREAFRLLRPGGVLIGSDSLASAELHAFHAGDIYNPIDPARLLVFLQAVGYGEITMSINHSVIFTARKPNDDLDA